MVAERIKRQALDFLRPHSLLLLENNKGGGAEKKTILEGQADLTHQLSGRFGARYTIPGYTSTGRSDYNPRDGVRAFLLPLQYWTDLDLIKMSSGIMSPVGG